MIADENHHVAAAVACLGGGLYQSLSASKWNVSGPYVFKTALM